MTAVDHVVRVQAFLDAWKYFGGGDFVEEEADPAGPLALPPLRLTTEDLAAVLDELKQLRDERADFDERLIAAQDLGLEKLEQAFGEGWDTFRIHLEDEARLKRGIYVAQFSNQLPWPAGAAPQQPEHDDRCGHCGEPTAENFAEQVGEKRSCRNCYERRRAESAANPRRPEHDGGDAA